MRTRRWSSNHAYRDAARIDIRQRVERFYLSISEIFEAWVTRRQSPHTQRAYREDFMAFIRFLGTDWPKDAWRILAATVKDVMIECVRAC